MANTKYHYYVMVFTSTGPVFVTDIGEHKTAYWKRTEKPKEFSAAGLKV